MATVADDRCTRGFVESLRRAGMDSVRINSAHVDPDAIRRMIEVIRDVDPAIRVLMDTKGPEIRTTALTPGVDVVMLNAGNVVKVHSAPGGITSAREICIAVGELEQHLRAGNELLLDDAAIALEVTDVCEGYVLARVTRGGALGARKTVAVPGVELPPLPAVSDRDRRNIAAARECGIDMIAHSFVRSRADVESVRELIEGTAIELYSKIECCEALQNLDEIIEASDGVLIARGDLGSQVDLWRVPAIQDHVALKCREKGLPFILSTQILDSMMARPLPTRAELSDIALAVRQGASTLLLTGETARGEYPEACVEIMRRTIEATERYAATGTF